MLSGLSVFHPLYNFAVRGSFQVGSGTSRSLWEEEVECAAFQGSPFHFGVIFPLYWPRNLASSWFRRFCLVFFWYCKEQNCSFFSLWWDFKFLRLARYLNPFKSLFRWSIPSSSAFLRITSGPDPTLLWCLPEYTTAFVLLKCGGRESENVQVKKDIWSTWFPSPTLSV